MDRLEAHTITFPASITKNKRVHVVPFGNRAEYLLRRGHGEGLLFPARDTDGKRPFDGWSKCKPKLDEILGISPWTLHDLRRTFATNLAGLGVSVHVTEKLLNHVSGTMGGIVGVYQRYDFMLEMREAIEKWERHVRALCEQA